MEMCNFFLVHFPMSSYRTRSGCRWSVLELRTGRKVRNCRFLTICAHVSLSMYLSITWPSFDVSWWHWFDFWFACRPLAPACCDTKNLALLWIVYLQSEESRAKRPKTSRLVDDSFEQPWAKCLLKCGIFSWCTSLCRGIERDQGGDGRFLSFERAERWEIVAFWPFVPTCYFQLTSLYHDPAVM